MCNRFVAGVANMASAASSLAETLDGCILEYLSLQWFRHRVDARVGIEQWRRHDSRGPAAATVSKEKVPRKH